MDENPTTEEWELIEAVNKQTSGDGPPYKVYIPKVRGLPAAGAKLVRYADDFVVLARYQGSRLTGWIESKPEGWLGLEINREKTRGVNLKDEGERLDFLGFTFRYDDDLKGRGWRYLNVSPSEKALNKEPLHEMTNHRQCFRPIPSLIAGLSRRLKGWKNYFDFGYPRVGFGEINTYVRDRLTQHLKRRSQRRF